MDLNFLVMSFIIKFAIFQQTSCIATPQQNFLVERKHGDILNVIEAFFSMANFPNISGPMLFCMLFT